MACPKVSNRRSSRQLGVKRLFLLTVQDFQTDKIECNLTFVNVNILAKATIVNCQIFMIIRLVKLAGRSLLREAKQQKIDQSPINVSS